MHDGLVHSCNAYFAQLAVELGPAPLARLPSELKIPLTPDGGSAQRRARALPQVGLRTGPGRRVSAAHGRAGRSRRSRRRAASAVRRRGCEGIAKVESIVDPDAARRLGGYMRDVVLKAPRRSLRGHPVPIAGKTGTAEVSGRDSHGWFVGFAPYGPST